ncbi:MAG: ADP-ribosylglycohydrolase family protein [Anaerorhabdus sp.]
MKAWEKIRTLTDNASPVILKEEEQTWTEANDIEINMDKQLLHKWNSNVPGSFAPESIMVAAVQAKENMGFEVNNSMELIEKGFKAIKEKDMISLNSISAELWHEINNASENVSHSYWKYTRYESFDKFKENVKFEEPVKISYGRERLLKKMYSGWLSQIIGGAFGTAMEGYTTNKIKEKLGDVRDYIREPNTFNDDITFEIAFLEAFLEKGCDITSKDVALSWVGYVPTGWSAEEIAINNIKIGIMPPESGTKNNPFSDWIGAQMRGAICGQLAPGDPMEAARLAWIDGSVSHSNSGIIGEVFNAMLVSLSFVYDDVKLILDKAINMLPKDSEYYEFANVAYTLCKKHDNWEEVFKKCEEKFIKYNWIHSYPNIMAEVVALYYGNGDFNETLHIVGMCGQDVDCNAAQIMTAIGTIVESDNIEARWREKIGDRLDTYIRDKKVLSIKELANKTLEAYEKRG